MKVMSQSLKCLGRSGNEGRTYYGVLIGHYCRIPENPRENSYTCLDTYETHVGNSKDSCIVSKSCGNGGGVVPME